jgi:hypothetical protein
VSYFNVLQKRADVGKIRMQNIVKCIFGNCINEDLNEILNVSLRYYREVPNSILSAEIATAKN